MTKYERDFISNVLNMPSVVFAVDKWKADLKKAKRKVWIENNKIHIRAYAARYRAKHYEEIRAYNAKYMPKYLAEHPEQAAKVAAFFSSKSKRRRRSTSGAISGEVLPDVFRISDGRREVADLHGLPEIGQQPAGEGQATGRTETSADD